ncbi:DNA/RNA non-specific endonuclease [Brasilonema sp. UFV-L1]|uniref:DNA/RNA non-specific endonuclease n=1 Tax=Brasilonema sp. UFV-L1 TaxID=2234130 RepID=UPI00145E90E9|nr:DNA/RNA non-specific endonuclease [Brasilonema sp. UFV-L1]NMG10280.1 hypothetical protein [Brasilonema sp. UFV-L1]
MYASATAQKPSVVWQGSTRDGYTLRLTRTGLARITSKLKQTGLENLVKSNMNGSLEGAVVRAIAQIVSNATRCGTLSRPDSGTNIQVFTAIGRTRNYQILTQPIDSKQAGIISIRSLAREISRESQYESESEYALQEAEYEAPNTRSGHLPRGRGYKTRSQTQPPEPGNRQNAPGHVAITGLQNLVDAHRGETRLPDEVPRFLPSGRRVAPTGGYIIYKGIVNGQRKGVTARITPSMLRQGSPAQYDFPFFTRRTGHYIVRAHLLARVLGGDGSNPRNLVPLYHYRNNLPMYQDIERRILKHVEKRGVVNFSATPEYRRPANDPLSVLPTHIVIRATNNRGQSILGLGRNQVTFSTGF